MHVAGLLLQRIKKKKQEKLCHTSKLNTMNQLTIKPSMQQKKMILLLQFR